MSVERAKTEIAWCLERSKQSAACAALVVRTLDGTVLRLGEVSRGTAHPKLAEATVCLHAAKKCLADAGAHLANGRDSARHYADTAL